MEDIRREFDEWVVGTWTKWAEKNRPAFGARDLYTRLYELHLRAEAEAATHEVVWGQFVLSARTDGSTVVAAIFTARAIVQVDTGRDHPGRARADRRARAQRDLRHGALRSRSAHEAATSCRETPQNVWDQDEWLAARQRIIAPIGLDAELVDAVDFSALTDASRLNDGWVLLLRKRPLRQERF